MNSPVLYSLLIPETSKEFCFCSMCGNYKKKSNSIQYSLHLYMMIYMFEIS